MPEMHHLMRAPEGFGVRCFALYFEKRRGGWWRRSIHEGDRPCFCPHC